MKIRPGGTGVLHADGRTDGQTDMTKPIFSFHNFVNVSEKGICNIHMLLGITKKVYTMK
jgi:hypothetical protein